MNTKQTLTEALQGRVDEVALYQLNIDNYRLAIAHIDTMSDTDRAELADFKNELATRLVAEIHQQKRALVMLAVIEQQVSAL
jgi:hypothetical protein